VKALRQIATPMVWLITVSLISLNLNLPNAHASIIGTGTVVSAEQLQQDRTQVREALERKEVRAQLVRLGVDPAQVQERVNALTDAEAQQLSRYFDDMPAGGNGLVGALVFVFVLLVFTDLLGLTSVFSFTKKGSLR